MTVEDKRQEAIPDDLSLPGYGVEPKADEAYVAEGHAAAHAWGVQYQGAFEGESDGTARAVRLHARALHAAGLPVFLQSFTGRFMGADGAVHTSESTSDRVKEEVKELVHASFSAFKVRIKHAVIPHSDFLRSWIIPRSVMLEQDASFAHATMQALYKQTIVYSVWERTTIDPNIIALLRRVGLTAFRPGDPAHLTIKFHEYSWLGYPTPEQSITFWLEDPAVKANGWAVGNLKPHLGLYGKYWTEEKIHALHFESNIYVACSHGEAFCLPAFDAKLAGNAMVHVPWGGTADFASEGDVALPFELELVPASYRWEPGAKWASIDFAALVRALKDVSAPAKYERNAYVEGCRFDRVGALMRRRVESVLRGE
jgi:hypothetical protein